MVSQLSLNKTFLIAAWTEVRIVIDSTVRPYIYWLFFRSLGYIIWFSPFNRQCDLELTSCSSGFLCCLFGATMYVYFSSTYRGRSSRRDRHTTVCKEPFGILAWKIKIGQHLFQGMIIISAIMFFIASFHLAINFFRLLRGYGDRLLAPGGPVGYLGVIGKWDHVLKDTLYATQENFGSGAAVWPSYTKRIMNISVWQIWALTTDLQMLGVVELWL